MRGLTPKLGQGSQWALGYKSSMPFIPTLGIKLRFSVPDTLCDTFLFKKKQSFAQRQHRGALERFHL